MNLISPFLAIFILASSTLAQQRTFDCSKQKPLSIKSATSWAAKVEKRYGALKSYEARFLQSSYLAALDTDDLSSGRMLFSKPGRMRWDYNDPETQTFITDGDTLWFYQEADKQVVVDKFDRAFVSDLPVSFIMGLGSLTKDLNILGGCVADSGVVLFLSPRKKSAAPAESDDSGKDLSELKLLIDSSTDLPRGAQVVDLGGNKTSFIFSEIRSDQPIDSVNFKPTFPEGVDMIDRRVVADSANKSRG